MTSYIFQPTSAPAPNQVGTAEWDDPGVWGGVVPNGAGADVTFPTFAHALFQVSIETGEAFSVRSIDLHQSLRVLGTLAVSGSVDVAGGGLLYTSGSVTVGSLTNEGLVSGSSGGTLTVGAMTNNGQINGAFHLVDTTLVNNGSITAVSNTLLITVKPGGFTNFSGGTLAGGSYWALAKGTVSFDLGALITGDATRIVLQGGGMVSSRDPNTSSYVPLTTSLKTVAASGSLQVQEGSYDFGNLTVAGTLLLVRGSTRFSSIRLTVASGGVVKGVGTIAGPIDDEGTIEALSDSTDRLIVAGPVTGSGLLEVGPGSTSTTGANAMPTLEIGAACSANVSFPTVGTLQLDDPTEFTGSIAFGPARNILLENISLSSITSTTYVGDTKGGTLTLNRTGGSITLRMIGNYVGADFHLAPGAPASSGAPPSVALTFSLARAASDFNDDGRSDILWRNSNGAISTWSPIVSGSSTTPDGIRQASYNGSADPSWSVADTFDWNGDGNADILWRNQDGSLSIWTGASSGFQQAAWNHGPVGSGWSVVGAGDLNGDGKGDLVWRNQDGSISTWLSTGSGFQENAYFHASVGTSWTVEGLGDFNGDGKQDLLWRNTDGSLSTWTSTGTGFQENSSFHAPVDRAWHVAGIGDFNGDGKDDILWRNDNGGVSVWASTGSGFTEGQFNSAASTDWHIAQVGDFNGDGLADILWRNDNGAVSIWHSNGQSFVQNSYSSRADSSWNVQAHHFGL